MVLGQNWVHWEYLKKLQFKGVREKLFDLINLIRLKLRHINNDLNDRK